MRADGDGKLWHDARPWEGEVLWARDGFGARILAAARRRLETGRWAEVLDLRQTLPLESAGVEILRLMAEFVHEHPPPSETFTDQIELGSVRFHMLWIVTERLFNWQDAYAVLAAIDGLGTVTS